ncbi:V-set and immunoglobulin domain-containing protein 1 isoform X2 [Dicentrarchus labrax]|uniref:V-set and immunoglobulin domain-containing protein 1 isoform X2 n=1 Tax=Dicentrarchus labrax TaxID=13489 RepID=UPI0021F64FE5|nr:V-set and immunoglobulin domain-containing protein 1 isoform X2 [Dicentrarchus labrax]
MRMKQTALKDVCVCLLISAGIIFGHETGPAVVRVVVEEGSDVILPCSLSSKENIVDKLFDWRKDGQKKKKEVFMYDAGDHYNNGRPGQDEQFKGRVSHFKDQLKNGNASIKINNTKISDSGNYTCDFPHLEPRQTFYIELVVGPVLKERSGEIPGAAPEPYTRTLNVTEYRALLQCEVRGASFKPKVEWKDSAGNILPAEEPQVSDRGGRYYVTLLTTVTKTDHYRCVVTQEEIHHQTHSETYVFIYEKLCEESSSKELIGWLGGGLVLGALILAAVLVLLVATKCIIIRRIKDNHSGETDLQNTLNEEESFRLSADTSSLALLNAVVTEKEVCSTRQVGTVLTFLRDNSGPSGCDRLFPYTAEQGSLHSD